MGKFEGRRGNIKACSVSYDRNYKFCWLGRAFDKCMNVGVGVLIDNLLVSDGAQWLEKDMGRRIGKGKEDGLGMVKNRRRRSSR